MKNILPRDILGKDHAHTSAQNTRFVVKHGPQAACFDVAFHRFVELKGWTMTDPRGLCSLESHAWGRSESKVISLWSRKAVDQFREFWPRYDRLYGADMALDVQSSPGIRVA
jgi:hypothetical protein